MLRKLYILANENVCSPAVIDFLVSLDDDNVRDGLVTDVFLEIALNQKRKVRFENELKKALKLRRAREGYISDEMPLCQYAVEDALSELSLNVRLNLVTKKIEIFGSGR